MAVEVLAAIQMRIKKRERDWVENRVSGVSSAVAKEKLQETKVEGWVDVLYVYIVL